ncbi:hypothetical protein CEXT_535241 [Caerostris extrusa]|uniref:Uncharacterized protein n=1 Tax=Caerostris extrusa TaxID=172846 RepID=A0AAV4Y4Y4_CAEEX|nr:hypothetical protein CEXT_535241 [Caerostris extrusa]
MSAFKSDFLIRANLLRLPLPNGVRDQGWHHISQLDCMCNETTDLLAKEGTSDVPISNDSMTFSEICSKIKTSNQQLWKILQFSPSRPSWCNYHQGLTTTLSRPEHQ